MPANLSPDLPDGEVLFEFIRIGDAVKISAIHVATDTEVCLVGPRRAGDIVLKQAVLRKLAYVLRQGR